MSPRSSYNAGLSHGTAMSDADCLRFYNGLVAATGKPDIYRPAACADDARRGIPGMMDILGELHMCASVGFAGTPVIRPIISDVFAIEAA